MLLSREVAAHIADNRVKTHRQRFDHLGEAYRLAHLERLIDANRAAEGQVLEDRRVVQLRMEPLLHWKTGDARRSLRSLTEFLA